MPAIDLNCDLGESFGAWRLGADAEILPHVSSVNVACGFHAGDPTTMRATVETAAARGVAVGAHPGLPDLAGFGRREMAVRPDEVYEMVVYQVGALAGFARAAGVELQHVKPHGALYHMAARDRTIADAIASAVRSIDPGLALYGLASGRLLEAGEALGLRTASEVFVDREYLADGSLAPRAGGAGVVSGSERVVERALRMVREGVVRAADGTEVAVRAETVCIHGDSPGAAGLARALAEGLRAAGIEVRAVGRR